MKKKIILAIVGVIIIAAVAVLYYLTPLGKAMPWWKRSSCGYNFKVSANPAQVTADNISRSEISVNISKGRKKRKEYISGAEVIFSTTLGDLSAIKAKTDSSGNAKVYLTSGVAGKANVTVVYGECSKNITADFTAASDSTALFNDDFSGDLSKWAVAWNGYGTVKIESGSLMTAPKASTSSGETHSTLVRAGDSSWGDYTLNLKMKTAEQLRSGSASNAWEAGWITFRHQDNSRFYYFILKSNGIELGKALGNDQQAFFVTDNNPQLQIGKWNQYKIVLQGNNIKVYIDSALVANYTDTNNPFLTGGIGLYDEDAKVYYDDVVVTE